MFSATTTEAAETTAAKWLRKPERVQIGFSAANISRTVVQTVHVCAEHKKPQKLLKHLQQIKVHSLSHGGGTAGLDSAAEAQGLP